MSKEPESHYNTQIHDLLLSRQFHRQHPNQGVQGFREKLFMNEFSPEAPFEVSIPVVCVATDDESRESRQANPNDTESKT